MSHQGDELRCNHVVKTLFEAARERKISIREIEDGAGLGSNVIYCWRSKKEPLLGNVIAALNVVGLDLAVVPKQNFEP
jgi:hypothetical protein